MHTDCGKVCHHNSTKGVGKTGYSVKSEMESSAGNSLRKVDILKDKVYFVLR